MARHPAAARSLPSRPHGRSRHACRHGFPRASCPHDLRLTLCVGRQRSSAGTVRSCVSAVGAGSTRGQPLCSIRRGAWPRRCRPWIVRPSGTRSVRLSDASLRRPQFTALSRRVILAGQVMACHGCTPAMPSWSPPADGRARVTGKGRTARAAVAGDGAIFGPALARPTARTRGVTADTPGFSRRSASRRSCRAWRLWPCAAPHGPPGPPAHPWLIGAAPRHGLSQTRGGLRGAHRTPRGGKPEADMADAVAIAQAASPQHIQPLPGCAGGARKDPSDAQFAGPAAHPGNHITGGGPGGRPVAFMGNDDGRLRKRSRLRRAQIARLPARSRSLGAAGRVGVIPDVAQRSVTPDPEHGDLDRCDDHEDGADPRRAGWPMTQQKRMGGSTRRGRAGCTGQQDSRISPVTDARPNWTAGCATLGRAPVAWRRSPRPCATAGVPSPPRQPTWRPPGRTVRTQTGRPVAPRAVPQWTGTPGPDRHGDGRGRATGALPRPTPDGHKQRAHDAAWPDSPRRSLSRPATPA
jgi:hypothetical protein